MSSSTKNIASKLASHYGYLKPASWRQQAGSVTPDLQTSILKASPEKPASWQTFSQHPERSNNYSKYKALSVSEHCWIFMTNIIFMIKTAAPWTLVFSWIMDMLRPVGHPVASFESRGASQSLLKKKYGLLQTKKQNKKHPKCNHRLGNKTDFCRPCFPPTCQCKRNLLEIHHEGGKLLLEAIIMGFCSHCC